MRKHLQPYSLFAYFQRDGRNTFVLSPEKGRDVMITGVRQLSVYYPKRPDKVRCYLVIVSYQPGALISFDARYEVSDYAHYMAAGIPFYFEFIGPGAPGGQNDECSRIHVEAHPLDVDYFFNHK